MKLMKIVRNGVGRKLVALLAVGIAVGAYADAATGRIRHMADTYLQSDGSQVIDLGILATTNMRVEAVFEPTLTNGTRYLFGSAGNAANSSIMKYGMYVQNSKISFASGTGRNTGGWSSGWHGPGYLATHSRFKVVYDLQKKSAGLFSGEASVWSNSSLVGFGPETNDCTVTLFGNHINTTGYTDLFGGKVYSFKLYDKGTLIRDLIPYGRGTVTGMLDRCSGKVYTNVRSAGHPFVLGTDDGYVRSDRAKLGGGQWLDTGFYADPQTKIEVDFRFMDPSTKLQRVFGVDAGPFVCDLYINSSGSFAWALQDDVGNWQPMIAADTARHTFTLDGPNSRASLAAEDGTVLWEGTVGTTRTKTACAPITVFGGTSTNGTGAATLTNPGSVCIYGMKIWNGATLVRDYVPRVVDGVEGLYDRANGTFVTVDTMKSHARLSSGGDVECVATSGTLADSMDAYLMDTNGQAIEPGYTVARNMRFEIDFAMDCFHGTQFLYGTDMNGIYYQLNSGVNRNINGKVRNSAGNTNWPRLNDGKATPSRYRVTADYKNSNIRFKYPNGTITDTAMTLPSEFPAAQQTMLIMHTRAGGGGSLARVYSFAVYEDDVLTHRYTPCVENGVAGMWDSVGKRFFGNSKTADGSGFTFHGAGMDGGGMVFTEQPQGGRLSRGYTLTLTAFAPGAAGYQWLKNGAIVEGATGRTLEVAYGEGGTTDTYQCVSYYDLFGYGASEVVQVENLPSGTVLIMR